MHLESERYFLLLSGLVKLILPEVFFFTAKQFDMCEVHLVSLSLFSSTGLTSGCNSCWIFKNALCMEVPLIKTKIFKNRKKRFQSFKFLHISTNYLFSLNLTTHNTGSIVSLCHTATYVNFTFTQTFLNKLQ